MSPSKPSRHDVVATEDRSVLGPARQVFLSAVQGAFGAMLGKLDDALFDLAQSAEDELERGNYFDAIRELRLGRETIETRFMDKLSACWDALERGDGPTERQMGGADPNEVIALTAAVRLAETECGDALRAVRDGLALAVGAPDGDEVIGPRQVFAAFETACRDTPANPAVRLIVLKFFERHVGAALPGLYRDLAAQLVGGPVGERRLPASQVDLSPLQGQTLPADEPRAAGNDDLSELIQNALAGGGQKGEVLKLLATLQQHDRPGSRSRSASIDLARIAAAPAGSDLSPQVVLDMVALLFDAVFTDEAVPVSARLQIARLQIPFLRLALRDRGMLARRSHLGRRFFDQLIAVTRAWHEPLTVQQQQVLVNMIDSFSEACMDDQRTFAVTAENSLADLRSLALPAPDSEAAAQAQRKALVAHVDTELAERRRRAGRLPNAVDTFLKTHWHQYLIDCLQRHGKDGSPWRQALATVDALLWSLSPKEGAARQRLADLRPRMIRRLRQGMDQVAVSMFEQEAFLEVLDEMLDRAQAGQPVWDWWEESQIEAVLGAEDRPQPPADAVTVVDIAPPTGARDAGAAANQDIDAVPTRQAPADEAPAQASVEAREDLDTAIASEAAGHEQADHAGWQEEVVDVDDLADELDEVAPLDLPSVDDELWDEPQVQVSEPDCGEQPPAEAKAGPVRETEPEPEAHSEAQSEPPAEPQAEPVSEPQASAGDAADDGQDQAPAADAGNSLAALLRRRGLSMVSQVEEIEVTERGSRS
ncbi:MAG: hypothetical protein Kow0073_14720 [Immundisolibacter sp.]